MTQRSYSRLLVLAVLMTVAAGAEAVAQSAGGDAARPTIWDGVYGGEQAQRGQKSYEKHCGYCHRDNLEGDEGPPLVGSAFTLRWRNHTLEDVFKMIQSTMPQDAPATLTPPTYVDIVSYLLKMNGAPPGTAELTPSSDQLARILFTSKPR